jgi:hypothetical protein
MNPENSPTLEQISKNKERLLVLEREGKYVFHGSQESLDILKPQQAKKYDNGSKANTNDKKPAVFATPYVEIGRASCRERVS